MKLLFNFLKFSIPFILYLMVVIFVDPYNYLNIFQLISDKNKFEISKKIEPHLYNMITFDNFPCKNVILGDSRSSNLHYYTQHNNWSNLAYGGGSIQEIKETFWWLINEKKTDLDTIVIGIHLNLYNKGNKRYWVNETIERKRNFFSYAFSRYAFQATFQLLRSEITGKQENIEKPKETKDEFWKQIVQNDSKKFYEQFTYPENYYKDLKNISSYCKKHKIKLILWKPPVHEDFYKKAIEYGLSKSNKRLTTDLQSIAEVYDFDYPCTINGKRENFADPMHYSKELGEIIYKEIMGKIPLKYGKFHPYSGK